VPCPCPRSVGGRAVAVDMLGRWLLEIGRWWWIDDDD
jgi:hypothetical protein